MNLYRTLGPLFLLSITCTGLIAAESIPSVTAPAVIAPGIINEEALPVFPVPTTSSTILEAQFKSLRRWLRSADCKVAPLSETWDPEALAFEQRADTAPADVEGLIPDTAQALDTLKDMVTSLGGTFELKSAYRSPAYQAHLHEVWVKWMKELRNNRSTGCRALREEVGAEFKRHKLLVKQQPVPASDHELGRAFDAAVTMPRSARLNGKRVTVDKLAALAGTTRPNSRRDPVHFKLLSTERPATMSYTQSPSFSQSAAFLP